MRSVKKSIKGGGLRKMRSVKKSIKGSGLRKMRSVKKSIKGGVLRKMRSVKKSIKVGGGNENNRRLETLNDELKKLERLLITKKWVLKAFINRAYVISNIIRSYIPGHAERMTIDLNKEYPNILNEINYDVIDTLMRPVNNEIAARFLSESNGGKDLYEKEELLEKIRANIKKLLELIHKIKILKKSTGTTEETGAAVTEEATSDKAHIEISLLRLFFNTLDDEVCMVILNSELELLLDEDLPVSTKDELKELIKETTEKNKELESATLKKRTHEEQVLQLWKNSRETEEKFASWLARNFNAASIPPLTEVSASRKNSTKAESTDVVDTVLVDDAIKTALQKLITATKDFEKKKEEIHQFLLNIRKKKLPKKFYKAIRNPSFFRWTSDLDSWPERQYKDKKKIIRAHPRYHFDNFQIIANIIEYPKIKKEKGRTVVTRIPKFLFDPNKILTMTNGEMLEYLADMEKNTDRVIIEETGKYSVIIWTGSISKGKYEHKIMGGTDLTNYLFSENPYLKVSEIFVTVLNSIYRIN